MIMIYQEYLVKEDAIKRAKELEKSNDYIQVVKTAENDVIKYVVENENLGIRNFEEVIYEKELNNDNSRSQKNT